MATMRAAAALAAAAGTALPLAEAFQCKSDTNLGATRAARQKGIALDDATLRWCPGQVPDEWPNSDDSMSSIRLFKAWDPMWDINDKDRTFDALKAYVEKANAKVLIGTQITCNKEQDDTAWEWTKQLVGKLHPNHVMGLAIGNELELLQFKDPGMVSQSCLEDIWDNGYLWQQFKRIVAEFNDMGFGGVPVTSVFTGMGLGGDPFYEVPGKARVNSFMKNATTEYGPRFAATWNFYPYFSPGACCADADGGCNAALAVDACWDSSCSVPIQIRDARRKMKKLTGSSDGTLWIGETGWSSQRSDTLTTQTRDCSAWNSMQTFRDYYKRFLEWDLSIGEGMLAPDHVFWFTMRDSHNFGQNEYFGLISECDEPACKIASDGYTPEVYQQTETPSSQHCGDDALFDGWSRGREHCENMCTMNPACGYFGIWSSESQGQYWCKLTRTCNTLKDNPAHSVTTYKKSSGASPSPQNVSPTPSPSPSPSPTPSPSPSPTPSSGSPSPSAPSPGGQDQDLSKGCRPAALAAALLASAMAAFTPW